MPPKFERSAAKAYAALAAVGAVVKSFSGRRRRAEVCIEFYVPIHQSKRVQDDFDFEKKSKYSPN